jgi:RNA polymerase sigma-70 factor, ECF subfamily
MGDYRHGICPMTDQGRHHLFSDLLARHHVQLYAYIFAIVRNREDAADLFQSVCLVLWRKFGSFQPGSSFFAWARETAKLVVRSFLRHKQKPLRYVREELLDDLTGVALENRSDAIEFYLAALQQCRGKLGAADQALLGLRYADGLGSREIADRLRRPQPSVCRSLNRIRRWLLECIRTELARQEHFKEDRHEHYHD